MDTLNLKEVLARMIADWKTRQNKNSFECGVQLEQELSHYPLDEISALVSELDKTRRMLRDVSFAFESECVMPHDSSKSTILRAIRAYNKTLTETR